MAIEDWSERVIIAHLAAEPQFSDDLQQVSDRHAAAVTNSAQPMDVVLDFAGVKFVTSSQIAQLLKLRKETGASGTRLVLCAVDAQVWGAFLVTGLDKVFEFSDAVPTALATLQLSRT
jgi:anti-anti-sigma factor